MEINYFIIFHFIVFTKFILIINQYVLKLISLIKINFFIIEYFILFFIYNLNISTMILKNPF